MTTADANKKLIDAMKEVIVKMNAQKNEGRIMAILNAYINECAKNSAYDQVANVNTLVRWASRGDIKGFLSAIQYKDTLTHINKI